MSITWLSILAVAVAVVMLVLIRLIRSRSRSDSAHTADKEIAVGKRLRCTTRPRDRAIGVFINGSFYRARIIDLRQPTLEHGEEVAFVRFENSAALVERIAEPTDH